ncbi:MAG: sugar phosphate isomerase/epimerase [Kiritimatiellae bacterium]|nr:sugar phosphate isomerase/epimerase [Kiritimatiellia bacterium]
MNADKSRRLPLTHFWPFNAYDKRVQGAVLAEFAEAGADGVVLNPSHFQAMAANPDEFLRWKRALAQTGMRFIDAHAPYGPLCDLSCPVPEAFGAMVAMHRQCLAICAEFGVGSCTIHVGRPTEYCKDATTLHENALRALDRILPAAEANRCVVCIENIWDPNNTAPMLLDAIDRFKTPWLGICWDSGHAQLSRSDSPDIPEQCGRTSWKNNGFPDGPREWSDTGDYLGALLPHIVTCHLHTNDRVRDRHWLPTDPRGLTDWAAEIPRLLSAPRLMQLQNEASVNPDNPFTPRSQVESLKTLVGRFAD